MTTATNRTEFLTDALIEQVNILWRDEAERKGAKVYPELTYKVAKKYIKVIQQDAVTGNRASVAMFIDKENGDVYKPASFKAPAKGVRYQIETLVESPELVDRYGSFLYINR